MTQILKRLEVIKASIALEDEEVIELQVMKLKQLSIDEDIQEIIKKLESSEHAEALDMIDAYLSKYSGVALYEDKELSSLKLELKSLESKLQNLIEEKTEYLSDIEEFNKEYSIHLGEIIRTILSLKKEILYKQTIKQQKLKTKYQEDLQTFEETQETIDELTNTIEELKVALESIDEEHESYDEIASACAQLQEELRKLKEELSAQEAELEKTKETLEDDATQEEFEEAKAHYDEFSGAYELIKEVQKDTIKLSEQDKAELKKFYRKAARLCHPDIMLGELKEKAHELMQQLNVAYSKNDLAEVKKILHALENGSGFEASSQSMNDKELIKEKIKEYKENIANLEAEVEEIKIDDTFETIAELEDWDGYFEELRNKLLEEQKQLEKQARGVLAERGEEIEPTQTEKDWIQILWDWADENDISSGKISKKQENLLVTTILDFTGLKLNYVPKEIVHLKNLTTLVLWDCALKYLPKEIVQLKSLKKLNIRTNPELCITKEQEKWINSLIDSNCTVYKDSTTLIDDGNFDTLAFG